MAEVPKIGFVGAGTMGSPMVERLLDAGQAVTLLVRRPEVVSRFADRGANVVSNLEGLASCDVVILCPFSEAQLRQILLGESGLLASLRPGAIVVQHATVSPDGIADLAGHALRANVDLVDAPISGRVEEVVHGRLTVLLGGASTAVKVAGEVVAAYAGRRIATGDVGSATCTKLVNNLLFAANAQLLGAALEVGAKLGVEEPALTDALSGCSGASSALTALQGIGSADAFGSAAAPYLGKDVALASAAARQLGADLGLIGNVIERGPFAFIDRSTA